MYYREQLLESYKYDALGEKYTRLHFTLLSHPMIRYRRYVVNDLLNVIGNLIIIYICNLIMSDYNSIYLNVSLFDKFVNENYLFKIKYLCFFFLIFFIVNAIIIIKQIMLPALMKKLRKDIKSPSKVQIRILQKTTFFTRIPYIDNISII